jgi:RsiW-degrading membrane proteinase PrsW (M82 family)
MDIKNGLKKVNWNVVMGIIIGIIVTQLDFIPHKVIIILSIIVGIAVLAYFIYSVTRQKRWDALIIALIGLLLIALTCF